jgi:hypothetical protein
MREKDATDATALRALRIGLPYSSVESARLISLLRDAARADDSGRYRDVVPSEEMTLSEVEPARMKENTQGSFRHVQPAYPVPDDMRQQVLDAMEEPVPEEYGAAQERYFERLSEGGR